ncbi:MAG TPA: hypothetical protein DHV26_11045 [Cytophagales bacterium]|nr:hypothetical protein [Cytophagales bacterium]HRG10367.1 hypothetical protein [Cyclobacteriaceae bacterium]
MSSIEIKRKLFDYIRNADSRKVKAMYTIVERDIEEETNIWTDDFVNEMSRRSADGVANLDKLNSWEGFKAKAKKSRG